MLHHLAELTYNYNYTTNSTSTSHLSGAALVPLVIGIAALVILIIASLWRIFTKAGKPGWAAIIPIYNTWVMAEIIGKPGWWGLYPLLGFIPIVGGIISFVMGIIFALGLAKSFGKSVVFAIFGLVIFSIVGYPMLGFGSAQYLGPNGEGKPQTGGAPMPPTAGDGTPVAPAAPSSEASSTDQTPPATQA